MRRPLHRTTNRSTRSSLATVVSPHESTAIVPAPPGESLQVINWNLDRGLGQTRSVAQDRSTIESCTKVRRCETSRSKMDTCSYPEWKAAAITSWSRCLAESAKLRTLQNSDQDNLYFFDLDSNRETQITRDGSDTLLNGTLSWLYWEEAAQLHLYRLMLDFWKESLATKGTKSTKSKKV